jgi:non-specific serine/threonine protein kinase
MRLDEVLAMSDEPTLGRAKALEAAGGVGWWRGDLEGSAAYYLEAMEICRQLDNAAELANSLYNYGLASGFGETIEVGQAQQLLEEAQVIYESLDDRAGLGDIHWGKANLELHIGEARQQEVKKLYEQAAVFYEEAGNDFGLGWTNFELGDTARRSGDFETAERRLRDGLRLFYDQGDLSGVTLFLAALSGVAFAKGDVERAHRLAGALHELRLMTGTDLAISRPNLVEGLEFEMLEALSGDAATPYRQGREMSVLEAVDYALGESAAG